MPEITGGHALAQMLRDYGVRFVFGVPGGQTLPLYTGIYHLQPAIRHILPRDERSAAFMADAFARLTGQPGVCDATVGPGATNLVSGVAESWGASIPLVVLTSDITTAWAGKGASQECDMLALLAPFTKARFRVDRVDKVPETVRKGFRIATTGRPGPVHLDFPADILSAKRDFGADLYVEAECGAWPARRVAPDVGGVREIAERLVRAERPVILAGGGVLGAGAEAEVVALAECLGAPVLTSVTGNGTIPHAHPLSGGVVGGRGYRECANQIVARADVLLGIGCKFHQTATGNWKLIPPGTAILQVDVDPVQIGKNYPVAAGLVADAKLAAAALRDEVDRVAGRGGRGGAWAGEARACVETWRAGQLAAMASDGMPIAPPRVLREVRDLLPDDGILVSGSSFTGAFVSAFFDMRRPGRSVLQMRGMAGLESAVPATIAAKLAFPDRPVVGITGDGGFGYTVGELETALRYGLPITIVILNNGSLMWIKAIQRSSYGDAFISTDFSPVQYARVAEAFGCLGLRVERPGEIKGALEQALGAGRPAVVEVLTDPWEFPPDFSLKKPGGSD